MTVYTYGAFSFEPLGNCQNALFEYCKPYRHIEFSPKHYINTSLTHNVKNSEALTTDSLSENNIKLGASSQNFRKSLHVFAATSNTESHVGAGRTAAASSAHACSIRYRKQFHQFQWPLPSPERDLLKDANLLCTVKTTCRKDARLSAAR